MLRAARFIAGRRALHPLVIGNFSCGPDSFIPQVLQGGAAGQALPAYRDRRAQRRRRRRSPAARRSWTASAHRGARRSPTRRPASAGRRLASLKDRRRVPPAHVRPRRRPGRRLRALRRATPKCCPSPTRRPSSRDASTSRARSATPASSPPATCSRRRSHRASIPPGPPSSCPPAPAPAASASTTSSTAWCSTSSASPTCRSSPPTRTRASTTSLGMVGGDFALHAWQGIVAVDLLDKCLHETRPYERRAGRRRRAATATTLRDVVPGRRRQERPRRRRAQGARRDFEALPADGRAQPLIGVVGEIFVRSNPFSQRGRRQEDRGPRRRGLARAGGGVDLLREPSELAPCALAERSYWRCGQRLVHDGSCRSASSHGLAARFEGFLRTAHEPSTRRGDEGGRALCARVLRGRGHPERRQGGGSRRQGRARRRQHHALRLHARDDRDRAAAGRHPGLRPARDHQIAYDGTDVLDQRDPARGVHGPGQEQGGG